jgi:hypothetical protein
VDYIFVGPQERELGIFTEFPGTVPVFQSGLVTIYAFQPELTAVMSQAVWPEAAWVIW